MTRRTVSVHRPRYRRKCLTLTGNINWVEAFNSSVESRITYVIDRFTYHNADSAANILHMQWTDEDGNTMLMQGGFCFAGYEVPVPNRQLYGQEQERQVRIIRPGDMLKVKTRDPTTTTEGQVRFDYREYRGTPPRP